MPLDFTQFSGEWYIFNYCPHSIVSEGYVFTGICLSDNRGRGWHQMHHHGIGHMVTGGWWSHLDITCLLDSTSPTLPLDSTRPPPWTAPLHHIQELESMCGWYTSYWNAILFIMKWDKKLMSWNNIECQRKLTFLHRLLVY